MEKLTGARWPTREAMGLTIDRDQFEPADYRRFELRLEECLVALERLLGRHGFGPARPPSVRSWSCP